MLLLLLCCAALPAAAALLSWCERQHAAAAGYGWLVGECEAAQAAHSLPAQADHARFALTAAQAEAAERGAMRQSAIGAFINRASVISAG